MKKKLSVEMPQRASCASMSHWKCFLKENITDEVKTKVHQWMQTLNSTSMGTEHVYCWDRSRSLWAVWRNSDCSLWNVLLNNGRYLLNAYFTYSYMCSPPRVFGKHLHERNVHMLFNSSFLPCIIHVCGICKKTRTKNSNHISFN
jgi:hypothetical protein